MLTTFTIDPHCSEGERKATTRADDSQQKNVVLAADFSQPDSFIVRYAYAIARSLKARLICEHILDPVLCLPTDGPDAFPDKADFSAELEQAQKDAIAEIHEAADRKAFFDAIVQDITRHQPILLLVGSHAHTETGRRLLGGVARKLSIECRVPTLVIGPPDELTLSNAGQWRRVLAATDFSSPATSGLKRAHNIAEAELLALHCIGSDAPGIANHQVEQLRMLAPFNEAHTVPVQHIVQPGKAGDLIVSIASKARPDLIVLGSPVPERAGVRTVESTICDVVCRVHSPVLLVPDLSAAGKPVAAGLLQAV